MTNDSGDNRAKRKITKKGILITALIVAGIVAASFLIYLMP